jgi:hypothetical protein
MSKNGDEAFIWTTNTHGLWQETGWRSGEQIQRNPLGLLHPISTEVKKKITLAGSVISVPLCYD